MTRRTTINPATEEVINTYEMITKEQISKKAKLRTRILFGKKTYIRERFSYAASYMVAGVT